MASETKIEWCDATWNPWIGCTKVSAGCKNCYAEHTTRARVLRSQGHETWGKGATRERTSTANWRLPLKWNEAARREPRPTKMRVFPSLCDWLDDEVPIEWLADFLQLIYDTPNLDWLLLTKSPENFLPRLEKASNVQAGSRGTFEWLDAWWDDGDFPENVWIGTSVEDQENANIRIPELLKIPAKVRFLSAEPLLGKIELDQWFWQLPEPICADCPKDVDCECGYKTAKENGRPSIDWVITGGESKGRPCNIEWIREIITQCRAASVPCFVKQVGSKAYVDPCPYCRHPEDSHGMGRTVGCQHGDGSAANPICGCRKMKGELTHGYGFPMAFHPIKHPKGGDMAEWPEDLQVREFPSAECKVQSKIKGDYPLATRKI